MANHLPYFRAYLNDVIFNLDQAISCADDGLDGVDIKISAEALNRLLTDCHWLIGDVVRHGRFTSTDQKHFFSAEDWDEKPWLVCYQCGKEVQWLAWDSRCKDCTGCTPEEVRGEV
jgi:hypothetical protein